MENRPSQLSPLVGGEREIGDYFRIDPIKNIILKRNTETQKHFLSSFDRLAVGRGRWLTCP